MTFINFNGRILPHDALVADLSNSAFRYGDGLFETIKYVNNRLQWASDHLRRLFNGLEELGYEIPSYFSANYLTREIKRLCKENGLKDARVRLSVFRTCLTLFDQEDNTPGFLIEATPLYREHPAMSITLGLFTGEIKSAGNLSRYKLSGAMLYRAAAIYANKMNWDDILLVNQYDRICDSCIANVFFVHRDEIITPPVAEGCVDGIFRRTLLRIAPSLGFKIIEQPVPLITADTADEIFLTNVIRGIIKVNVYHDRELSTTFTEQISEVIMPSILKEGEKFSM